MARTGLLAAIRHVLANDKAHDTTTEQREARKWLRQDRTPFFAKYADLEKAGLSAAPEGTAADSRR